MRDLTSTFSSLRQEGWSLDEDASIQWLEKSVNCIGTVPEDCAKQAAIPSEFFLALRNANLKKIGAACLPDDINRADSRRLTGPHILQVVDAVDIAQPSRTAAAMDLDRKNRLLRVRLTDGSRTAMAIEYLPLQHIKTSDLIPGVKVKIQGATIRLGVILLDSKSIEVLGGRVEALAEGWEVQQHYGGTPERSTEKNANAADRPPSFMPFNASGAWLNSVGLKGNSKNGAIKGGCASMGRQGGKQQKDLGKKGKKKGGIGVQRKNVEEASRDVALPCVSQGSAPQNNLAVSTSGLQEAHVDASPGGVDMKKPSVDQLQLAASSSSNTSSAAKKKLLDKLQAHEEEHGRFGRGSRRGARPSRRSRYDGDADDQGSLTLEEWESRRKESSRAIDAKESSQMQSDEQLARQLQRQMDFEDPDAGGNPSEELGSSSLSMFHNTDGHMRERGGGRVRRGRGGRSRTGGRRPQGS